jgi:RimJ/RimL family protein N-acetyltransferase
MPAGVAIRRLEPADAAAFRDVRLAGLTDAPAAFGSSVEEEADKPLAFFEARIAMPPPGAIFGAFVDGRLAGIARFSVAAGVKKQHIGEMTSVSVPTAFRGRGLATRLVDHVIAHASRHVVVLRATVVATNGPARAIYLKAGFQPFGVEPRALFVDGRYYDEELLNLDVDRAAPVLS